MSEESTGSVRSEATDNPLTDGSRHDDAFAEAFAASLADPNQPLPSTAIEDPVADAAASETASDGQMPTILLVQAGLTVFNAVIILIYIVFWIVDINAIANALRAGAAFAFLLSLAPALLGAYLVRRYTKQKINPPGAIWAHAGVYVGVAMCTLTLVIPMIVTVRTIIGAQ